MPPFYNNHNSISLMGNILRHEGLKDLTKRLLDHNQTMYYYNGSEFITSEDIEAGTISKYIKRFTVYIDCTYIGEFNKTKEYLQKLGYDVSSLQAYRDALGSKYIAIFMNSKTCIASLRMLGRHFEITLSEFKQLYPLEEKIHIECDTVKEAEKVSSILDKQGYECERDSFYATEVYIEGKKYSKMHVKFGNYKTISFKDFIAKYPGYKINNRLNKLRLNDLHNKGVIHVDNIRRMQYSDATGCILDKGNNLFQWVEDGNFELKDWCMFSHRYQQKILKYSKEAEDFLRKAGFKILDFESYPEYITLDIDAKFAETKSSYDYKLSQIILEELKKLYPSEEKIVTILDKMLTFDFAKVIEQSLQLPKQFVVNIKELVEQDREMYLKSLYDSNICDTSLEILRQCTYVGLDYDEIIYSTFTKQYEEICLQTYLNA